MCGLVGAAGMLSYNVEKAFRMMLELDTIRGPHSTGIFAVKSDKTTILAKTIGTPWELYETKPAEKVFQAVTKVLIGHNRWATKGKINKTNAHPFEFNNIAGAHNGTLRSTANLDDSHMFDVDSENLYYHMNKHGVYDTVPKLNGAYALTWYDKKAHTMNLLRNHERPLFFTFTEDKKTLLWASEEWMLIVAASKNEVKIEKPREVPVGNLMSFEIPAFGSDPFQGANVHKMEMYKSPVTTTVFDKSKTTTESNKVVTLRPTTDTRSMKVKKSFAEYQKHVGKEVVFFVDGPFSNNYGQEFIQCWLVGDEDISIRVHTDRHSLLGKKLLGSVHYFLGHAKSYSALDNGSLSIDLRTIEECHLDEVKDDAPVLFVGHEGVLLDQEQFDDATKHGCAWCSSHVTEKDADDIHWIGKTEFICGDCADQPEVKTYLSLK